MANETPKPSPSLVAPTKTQATTPSVALPNEGAKITVPPTSELIGQHQQKRKYTRRQKQEDTVQAPIPDAALQVNIDLLKKSIHAIAQSADGFVVRTVYKKCKRITGDEETSAGLARDVGMTKSEVEVVSEATTLIFARHEVLMRHAPEVMLLAVGVSYTSRFLFAMGRLDKMEKELKKAQSKPPGDEDNKR